MTKLYHKVRCLMHRYNRKEIVGKQDEHSENVMHCLDRFTNSTIIPIIKEGE